MNVNKFDSADFFIKIEKSLQENCLKIINKNFLYNNWVKERDKYLKLIFKIANFIIFCVIIVSCSTPRNFLKEANVKTKKITVEKAYNAVTGILVDQGFDIKLANKDIGLITTEYKQFASVAASGQPPFDLYLQFKIKIKNGNDGKVLISVTPISKDVNRLNSAAFNEHELIILKPEEQSNPSTIDLAYLKGQLLLNNFLQSLSELTGIGMEKFEYNIFVKEQ